MHRLAVACACAAVLACTSPSSPPPLDPTSVAGFCEAAVPKWCDWLDVCNPAEASETVPECVASNLGACQRDFGALAREVAAGRLGWDPDRARGCLDALATQRCGDVRWASCQELFRPAVAPGGSCAGVGLRTGLASLASPDECLDSVEHHFCSSDGVCGGTCPSPSPIGGSCGATDEFCEPDAYCDSRASMTCQPRKALGEPCGDHQACQAALWCRAPDGTACSYSGYGCTCAGDLAPGDACQSSSQCPAPLECRDGICRSRTGAAGQSCTPTQWKDPPCEAGFACLRAPTYLATCGPPRAEGEPCLAGDECVNGLLCRSDRRCGRPSPEGGPCAPRTAENWHEYEGDCAAGLSCVGSSCVPTPSAPGDACDPPTTYCYGAEVSCNPILHRCEAVAVEPGASCSGMCAWDRGLYCGDAGSCRVAGGPGTPCTAGRECFSMTCGPDGRCVGPCGW